jgi:predicted RNase H-like HicB family nuclease
MSKIQFNIGADGSGVGLEEKLTLKPDELAGCFKSYTGESGDFWVSIIPSLNVSGYGETAEEAQQDLKDNLNIMLEALFEVSELERHLELKKLGWVNNRMFKKKYSKAYVDENGVLQNFSHPDRVRKEVLVAA